MLEFTEGNRLDGRNNINTQPCIKQDKHFHYIFDKKKKKLIKTNEKIHNTTIKNHFLKDCL